MTDFSHLDRKYFIDRSTYNCPFCNRNHVPFTLVARFIFDWNENKECCGIIIKCTSCNNKSLHLSFSDIAPGGYMSWDIKDFDSVIFYSVPTSFFVLDDRINVTIRELITEAEGCLKLNFLTGASACMRKAIYELLVLEKAEGDHYEDRIKSLKNKYPSVDPVLFDILGHIQDMTSDKVHEQSWDKWDSKTLYLLIETLKAVLHEMYVVPAVRAARTNEIKLLREIVSKKQQKQETETSMPKS